MVSSSTSRLAYDYDYEIQKSYYICSRVLAPYPYIFAAARTTYLVYVRRYCKAGGGLLLPSV